MSKENKYAREVEEMTVEFLEKNNYGVMDCEKERIKEINTKTTLALEKGEAIGLEKGKKAGLKEGKKATQEETATRMLKDGMDEKSISKYTGFSLEKIKKLKTMVL